MDTVAKRWGPNAFQESPEEAGSSSRGQFTLRTLPRPSVSSPPLRSLLQLKPARTLPAGPSSGKARTRPDLRSSGRRKGLAPRLPSGLSSFIPLCGKLAPSRMSPLTNSEMTLPQMRRRCLPASLPSFKIYFLSFCHPCSH